jgi:hypothetical protein
MRLTQRLCLGLLGAAIVMVLGAGTALARPVRHPHVGELPGFPAIRGVVPVLGSSAAIDAHEQRVRRAFARARAHTPLGALGVPGGHGVLGAPGLAAPAPVPNEEPPYLCLTELQEVISFETLDVCDRGGPVLHGPTIHLIFWQGPLLGGGKPTNPKVGLFSAEYVETVEHYFRDLAHDSGLSSDTFAVDPQYGEEVTPGKYTPGEYRLAFAEPADATVDTTDAFPEKCTDQTPFSEGPCMVDEDIQKEVTKVATSHGGWPTESLQDVYVVLTPPGVGSCFEASSAQCSYSTYCAYHSDFGGEGIYEPPAHPGKQTLYADLPFLGEVLGCDSEIHPNSAVDNGADAVIDTASHELDETITDPLGSQCDEEAGKLVGCEHNAWTDAIGQEIGDKCLPPEVPIAGIYGPPLAQGLGARAYNQLINGDRYWTQREWSNEAGAFEGACVQRAIGASFTTSTNPAATVPATFDGSGSGAPGDPAVYWVWDFEGEQVGTASSTTSHTYRSAGEKQVTLTAYDAFGNAEATSKNIEVAAAPAPLPPPKREVETTTTTTTTTDILQAHPEKLSLSQLALALKLPSNGQALSGAGTIVLGNASCPPACALSARLLARVSTTRHGRRGSRLLLVGRAQLALTPHGAQAIAVNLNARGHALLEHAHRLKVTVQLAIEDQQGATWRLTRSLTLTSTVASSRARG